VPWTIPAAIGHGCNTPCIEITDEDSGETLIIFPEGRITVTGVPKAAWKVGAIWAAPRQGCRIKLASRSPPSRRPWRRWRPPAPRIIAA